MNGIENIIEKINQKAQAETEAKISEAEAAAKAVKDGYCERAEAAASAILSDARKQAEMTLLLAEGNSSLENNKLVLKTKHELIDEAFSLAERQLASMPENEYIDLLCGYVLFAAPDGRGELILNARDREKIGEKLLEAANAALISKGIAPKLSLSDKVGVQSGGFILKNGDIETDCSLSAIIGLLKNDLVSEVAEVLFG